MANKNLIMNDLVKFSIENDIDANEFKTLMAKSGAFDYTDIMNAGDIAQGIGLKGKIGSMDGGQDGGLSSGLDPSKMSNDQKLAFSFGNRMNEANSIIDTLDEKISERGIIKSAKEKALGGTRFATEETKSYDQAKRNFINAALRRESGAAIAESEFENAEQQYFPKPGDSPEILSQKKANRDMVVRDMLWTSGVDNPDAIIKKTTTKEPAGEQPGAPSPDEIKASLQEKVEYAMNHPDDPLSSRFLDALENDKIDLTTGKIKDELREKSPAEKLVEEKLRKAGMLQDEEAGVEQGAMPGEQPKEKKGFFRDLVGDIKEMGEGFGEAARGVIGTTKEAMGRQEAGEQGMLSTGFQALGAFGKGMGEIAGEIAKGGVKAVLPQGAEEFIGEKAKQSIEGIMKTELGQQGMALLEKGGEEWSQFESDHPALANNLKGVAGILEGVASVASAGEAGTILKAGKEIAQTGVKVAGKGVGIAGKGVGLTAKAPGAIGKELLSKTTTLKKETIDQLINEPQKFTKEAIKDIDEMKVVNKVKAAIEQGSEELASTGKAYESIKKLDKPVNIGENTIKDFLSKKGIKVDGGKVKTDLASELQLSKADAKSLGDVMESLTGKETLSPKEVLNLRTKLSEISSFGEGKTGASKQLAKQLRAEVDRIAKKEIPGLKELDAKYAPQKKVIGEFKKKFMNPDGTLKDNAMSQINNLTGKNKEIIMERVKKLVPGVEKDLNILNAMKDISSKGGFNLGQSVTVGVAGGVVNPVAGLALAIGTSPKVAVPIIRTYGKAKGFSQGAIGKLIGKMESGKKLTSSEKKFIGEAIDNKLSMKEKAKAGAAAAVLANEGNNE